MLAMLGILLLPTLVLGREGVLKPALGDISIASPGPKRVEVMPDGGWAAFSYHGRLLPSFPQFIVGEDIISSPVLADMADDALSEVTFITRDAQDKYRLYVARGDGSIIASALLSGEPIYDPVVSLKGANGKRSVLVGITSNVLDVRVENGALTLQGVLPAEILLSISNKKVGVAVDQKYQNMMMNSPSENSLSLFHFENNGWDFVRGFDLPSPVAYPVVFDDANNAYGVLKSGKLFSVDLASSEISVFATNLSSLPLDTPLLFDADSDNAGKELVVSLADGSRSVLSLTGTQLSSSFAKQSFLSLSTDALDNTQGALFTYQTVGSSELLQPGNRLIVSPLSDSKFYFSSIGVEIQLSQGETEIADGSDINLGNLFAGTTTDVIFSIQNTGSRDLILTGTSSITIAGNDADRFGVVQQPASLIPANSSVDFSLRITPNVLGPISGSLVIANTDADESPYNIILGVVGANDGSFPIVYEDAQDGDIAGWFAEKG
ncbi:MAG: choice-of-anchor D domain-containing protein, partial [Patescibacteria group bacterium]